MLNRRLSYKHMLLFKNTVFSLICMYKLFCVQDNKSSTMEIISSFFSPVPQTLSRISFTARHNQLARTYGMYSEHSDVFSNQAQSSPETFRRSVIVDDDARKYNHKHAV